MVGGRGGGANQSTMRSIQKRRDPIRNVAGMKHSISHTIYYIIITLTISRVMVWAERADRALQMRGLQTDKAVATRERTGDQRARSLTGGAQFMESRTHIHKSMN